MATKNILGSLDFTSSAGNKITPKDDQVTVFNDASYVGGFPIEQKIIKIERIEVFADMNNDPTSVIVGLNVRYTVEENDAQRLVTVSHGIVTGSAVQVGVMQLKDEELLVGASGLLRNLPSDPNKNNRISHISFTVFNKTYGSTSVKGPFTGQDSLSLNIGDSWATYGPIIALQGTVTQKLGLTSLGFAKLTRGVPAFGVFTNL